jgi:hypothetical protein
VNLESHVNEITPWEPQEDGALERRGAAAEVTRWLADVETSITTAAQRVRVDMQLMELRAEAEIMQDRLDRGRG